MIPNPTNIKRRIESLASHTLFLRTYFAKIFFEEFTKDRLDIIHSIVDAAMYGGDQAIAGPRGEGKTKLAIFTALYLMVSSKSRFPVVIGKSQSKAQSELKLLRDELQQNELLRADFPELCVPFNAVGGWASRARLQTVFGTLTNIAVSIDHLIFPRIDRSMLHDSWPDEVESCADGQIIASVGIDGPIRGLSYRNERPTIAIIDDIEDREAADSETLIEKNTEIIEQDIGGLGASARRISRVFLCTIQNRKCVAYQYTDAKTKPSWRGRRYRKMLNPPDRMDLVDQYVSMRRTRAADDPDARIAFAFWRDNQSIIESGCVVSNQNSYDPRLHPDGFPLELSAIQAYYNRVADFGEKAVATEIDNDPPEEAGPVGMGLTAEMVASRNSGLDRRQLPANTVAVTAGIDLGKYRCHWVVTAWWGGAGGCVVDYGVLEVTDTDTSMNHEASEPQIYKALLEWRDMAMSRQYVDATGIERKLDFVLVDSGTFTNAAYEFVRQVRGVFHPSKGVNPYYRRRSTTSGVIASENLHAVKFDASGIWLYELDTNYWKQFVHERFLTPTFDENNMLRRGSLSLFSADREMVHNSYAHHIVAEEYVSEFKEGKGSKSYWRANNENNHWLDATYLAAAASEVCGVKLIAPSEVEVQPRQVSDDDKTKAKTATSQQRRRTIHGSGFRTRPGGWIPRRTR